MLIKEFSAFGLLNSIWAQKHNSFKMLEPAKRNASYDLKLTIKNVF